MKNNLAHIHTPDGRLQSAAVVLLVIAAYLWVSAFHSWQGAQEMLGQARAVSKKSRSVVSSTHQSERSAQDSPQIPSDRTFSQDLAQIFAIAKGRKFVLTAVDYRIEPIAGTSMHVRTMEIQTQDEYPKVKAFASDVLAQLHNASVKELRVARKDPLTSSGSMAIKLALIYDTAESTKAMAP